MSARTRIGQRILIPVGLVVIIGLLAVIMLYAQRQERSILALNERALIKVTNSTVEGMRAVMMRGHAEIARDFAQRLKKVDDVLDYRVLRSDGSEAFIDNRTIEQVNAGLGLQWFKRRENAKPAPQVLGQADSRLAQVLAARRDLVYYETLPDGERTVTVLAPIVRDESCQGCHSGGSPVRGVLKLTTSLRQVESDIAATWRMSIVVVLLGLGGIFAAVYGIVRRSIVSPIRKVTVAMATAARGDLSIRVPVIGRDEIADMAGSFNQMSARLRELYSGLADEQNKLTTIILGAREGIIVTNENGGIVLINPAACKLLCKPADRIERDGFLHLVDDPEWMEWRLASDAEDSHAGILAYAGRKLMIEASTIRGASGAITGSSAIIRDVTAEQDLQAELQRLAVTDALTGLYNRRHFDQRIGEEWARWRRYQGAFSLLMLDVDHFKRLNDDHGHDRGDRVLQAVAASLRDAGGPTAVACRYGGEEFVLILPEQDQPGALLIAEALRRAVEAMTVEGLQVTVSIGVAGAPTQQPANAEALVRLADAALYEAKNAGRNRVCAARPEAG